MQTPVFLHTLNEQIEFGHCFRYKSFWFGGMKDVLPDEQHQYGFEFDFLASASEYIAIQTMYFLMKTQSDFGQKVPFKT